VKKHVHSFSGGPEDPGTSINQADLLHPPTRGGISSRYCSDGKHHQSRSLSFIHVPRRGAAAKQHRSVARYLENLEAEVEQSAWHIPENQESGTIDPRAQIRREMNAYARPVEINQRRESPETGRAAGDAYNSKYYIILEIGVLKFSGEV